MSDKKEVTKEDALCYLRGRRYHFLDKCLFGRAEIMKDMVRGIEDGSVVDYSSCMQMGLECNFEDTEFHYFPR